VIARPSWLIPRARAWHHQTECVIERVDENGVVLARYRRGFNPLRRLLTPQETAYALEYGELRPRGKV